MRTLQAETLSVDDLLDLSGDGLGDLCKEGDDCTPSVSAQEYDHIFSSSSLVTCSNNGQELSESLYFPPEELADELEWLSTFVEDSYRGEDQSMPLVSSEQWFRKSGSSSREEGWCGEVRSSWTESSWLRMGKNGVVCHILDMGSNPLIENGPGDAVKQSSWGWEKRVRSKRCNRSGGRVWCLQTVVPLKEDEEEHSQTSCIDYEQDTEQQLPPRKRAKKEHSGSSEAGESGEEGRRCSHCQAHKTPQWRARPLGPKTLCNACGVRFKSGRLLPEYRPAASPTFITELHSNSHRKVLQMRSSNLVYSTGSKESVNFVQLC